jgi:hypothetical protein
VQLPCAKPSLQAARPEFGAAPPVCAEHLRAAMTSVEWSECIKLLQATTSTGRKARLGPLCDEVATT